MKEEFVTPEQRQSILREAEMISRRQRERMASEVGMQKVQRMAEDIITSQAREKFHRARQGLGLPPVSDETADRYLAAQSGSVGASDAVEHPGHYNTGKIEVIEFIEDQRLNFNRGTAVKYVSRAGRKDPLKEVEDLQKAVFYLRREIELLSAERENREPCRPNQMSEKK